MTDLKYCLDPKNRQESFFLGNFTFKIPQVSDRSIPYDVIDGQQRITTFVLLGLALKIELNKRKDEDSEE